MLTNIHFLFLILGLTTFWYVYHAQYRELRIAYFRERMFDIRDGLFEAAKNGKMSFDDDAYVMMRQTLNGMIRFAHEMSFTEILISSIRSDDDMKSNTELYKARWASASENLTKDQRKIISHARWNMHMYAFSHMVKNSLLLHSFVLVIKAVLATFYLAEKLIESTEKPITSDFATTSAAMMQVYDRPPKSPGQELRDYLRIKLVRKSEPMHDTLDSQAISIGREKFFGERRFAA